MYYMDHGLHARTHTHNHTHTSLYVPALCPCTCLSLDKCKNKILILFERWRRRYVAFSTSTKGPHTNVRTFCNCRLHVIIWTNEIQCDTMQCTAMLNVCNVLRQSVMWHNAVWCNVSAFVPFRTVKNNLLHPRCWSIMKARQWKPFLFS